MIRIDSGIRLGLLRRAAPWAIALALPGMAEAADAAAGANTTGEVVVTAQFREQNLQQTPLAITAVNAQMLENRSQTNLFQVASQAPNVTLKPAGAAFGAAMVAFIRGVGQTDFNFSQEPGVGIYIDDVYHATLTGSLLDLTDLDRVEILRGPQGTLAGRNAIGGAIKLYSKKPNSENGGWLEGTYGSDNRIDIRGVANFVVVPDQLFVRITGASRHRDGYVTRVDYRCTHPSSPIRTMVVGNGCKLGEEGGQSYNAFKIAARWLASENLEVNVWADATNDQSPVQANTLLFARANGLSLDGVPYGRAFVPYGPNKGAGEPNDPFLSYATFTDPEGGPLEKSWKPVVVDPINHYRSYGVAGTIDWKLNDMLSVKSITSWRRFFNSFAEDTPASPIGVQLLLQTLRHVQVNQEVRLNAKLFNDTVDLTLGGFYADQSGNEEARVDLPYVGAGAPYACIISPAPCGFVRNFAFDFIHGPDQSPSTSKAVFGHVDWRPTELIEVLAGIRYSKDEKSYVFQRHNPDGTLPCATPNLLDPLIPGCANWLVFGVNDKAAHFQGDRVDYRGNITLHPSKDLLFYGQIATGYKGGGSNARPFFAGPPGPTCPIATCQVVTFNPETLTSYEIGFKASLFDHRMRFNGAGFFNKYNDIILQLSSCPENSPGATLADRAAQPCALPVNAGNADVKGLEFETEIHPVGGLEFDGNISYLDFKYTKIPNLNAATGLSTSTGISINGVTPYTPKWKWSFGAQYEFRTEAGTLTPRVDVSYQSDIFTSPLNQPSDIDPAKVVVPVDAGGVPTKRTDRISAYTVANARITWRSMDGDWTAAFEVTNFTDKLYYYTYFDLSEGGLPGYTSGQPARGREWAISIHKRF
jgi:iron complex outermembrane receptor protein